MSEEKGLPSLRVKDCDELEDIIRQTPVNTVVEVTFFPRSNSRATDSYLGYLVGVGVNYNGGRIRPAVRVRSSGAKKMASIAIEGISLFVRYDAKTPYAFEHEVELPPRRRGRINLKSEFM